MTESDVARNGRALRNLAARLERMGYDGDSYAEAEHIAVNLLADGWHPIEPIPPVRPANPAPDNSPGRREFTAARAALANRQKEHQP